jgi:hypothetical protein
MTFNGDINITGVYKKNNSDVIVDTSNYVTSTSNILVTRVNINDTNSSNYIVSASNILVTKANLNDTNTSNYIVYTSNILVTRANLNDTNTSNYVLSTSNILVPRIMTEVGYTSNYVARINTELITAIGGKQASLIAGTGISIVSNTITATSATNYWTNINTNDIYYNLTGKVGVGINNAVSKLHLYDSVANTTTLTIQNEFTAGGITATPTSTGTTGNYTYMVFTYTTGTTNTAYTITAPAGGVVCDILVVGGGGSGSQAHGGGGGAGAVIFMKDVNMNGDYTIKVGKGGVCGNNGVNGLGGKGKDTEIFKTNNIANKIVAEGGGGGGELSNANGGSGGSGGGGDAYNIAAGSGGAATAYTPILDGITGIKYGNNGGNAIGNPGHGGGGGGAGGAGENATGVYNTGNDEAERAHGGVGIKSATINSVNYDFKTLFGTNSGAGVLEADTFLYFGGGGGNGRWQAPLNTGEGGNGGLGGGGKGGWGGGTSMPNNGKGYPGTANTGGGGGGGGDNSPLGGDGGSGVVIIRYMTPSSSSTIELLRGTTTDANIDYNIGNYDGEFKVKSSISGIPSDRLTINSSGNVTINGDVNITGIYKKNNSDVIQDTSNYITSASNILIGRINDTSNYVRTTSNILIGRISDTSNYVVSTCNILVTKANLNDTNSSNYIVSTSNILVTKANLNDINSSNYVLSTCNILVTSANLNNTNSSNYIVSTSNILVDAIKNNKSSQWTTSNNNIYYNTYNVGIGTAIPINKLHLYDDTNNDTKLTIQNNTNVVAGASPTEISVSGATPSIIGGTDRMLAFPYSGTATFTPYSFTPTENLVCDILVVGGGGGGGKFGGGGGAGAILFGANIKLTSGNLVSIKVGKGGAGATINDTGVNGINGENSSITIGLTENIAVGGGGGGSRGAGSIGTTGNAGGSGGGGSHANAVPQGMGGVSNKQTFTGFQSFGFAGGIGKLGTAAPEPTHASGGGGGAGSVGGNGTGSGTGTGGGNGGAGQSYISYFGSGVGHAGWFGGGGGGNTYAGAGNVGYGNGGNGLLGGGGNGGFDGGTELSAVAGLANTGGGGGGGKYDGTGNDGGSGGTGYVIIRYRKESSTSSSLELVRGTTTDGAVDYSVGNYDGVFKIKSVDAGTPTDRLAISSAGNVDVAGSVNITGSYKKNNSDVIVDTSNYVVFTSNILVPRILSEVGFTSNYVVFTSNILVPRILSEVGFTSNYITSASNILVTSTNLNNTNSSNYIASTSNILINRINNSSFWTAGTGSIYYNGGNVGIGTTDPLTYKLNVTGSINATDYKINGVALNIGALSQGMTVQTKHLTYTQMDVKNNTGWEAINDDLVNGFVIAITPASASSKILVNMIAHIGTDYATDSRWWGIKLYRKIGAGGAWTEITGANGSETGAAAATAGTPIWVSDNMGSTDANYQYFVSNVTGTYLDAPNTTSIVYYTAYWSQKLGIDPSAVGGIYINRASTQNDAYRPAPSSSWTATEIWDLGTPYVPPSGDTTITIASSSVGVGATPNANYKLIVNQGTSGATGATCFPLKISAGAFTNAGNSTATLIGLGTETSGWSKCAIGHTRKGGGYDVGDIVFLCNNTVDSSQVSMTNEKMRIASDGNVGIGTNNPGNILQVGGGGRLRIANDNSDYTMIGTRDTNSGTNTQITMYGNTHPNTSSPNPSYAGRMEFMATASGPFVFFTTDSTTERLRITSTGNVGIGTNNPATILEVVSPSPIFTLRSSDNGGGKIYFGNSSHGVGRNAGISTLTGGNDVTLWTAGDGSVGFVTNGIERMRIASNGNVGIGTTNSANGIYSILHIKGTNPIFTIQGQGGLGAKSQINLSTYDTSTTNASGCSLIATDDGAYGSTFQINLKTSGANTNTQFTALQINTTGNVGISKTSHATYKLDVDGSVNATSYLLAGVDILTKITETSNYVASTSNILVTKANLNDTNSSNYVARISTDVNSRIWTTSQIPSLPTSLISGLDGALSGKQAIINSIANQIIIGNGNGSTTTSTGLTFNTISNTLETSNIIVNGNLTISSNLIVYGNKTTLETYVYTTENLEVVNTNINSIALMVQQSNSGTNDIFVASNQTARVFNIANNGDVNISGIYKRNNRDVLEDTSNYVTSTSNILVIKSNLNDTNTSNYVVSTSNILITRVNINDTNTSNYVASTSNILVDAIKNNKSSQWTTSNNNINYNTSNVGIGTFVPTSKLHLFDNINETKLTIQNNFSSEIINEIISDPIANYRGIITGTQDRYMIFNSGSSFTIPPGGINCDILMIGGGGGGHDAGGGAGACIVAINQLLPEGSCSVAIGTGGGYSTNGTDSSISVNGTIRYLAKGGGGGGGFDGGDPGGCGGGAGIGSYGTLLGALPVSTNIVNGSAANIGPSVTTTYAVFGNRGGNQNDANPVVNSSSYACAGGGGIGAQGIDHANGDNNATAGGAGLFEATINFKKINFRNYFANGLTSFGVKNGITDDYYIGGGGGGGLKVGIGTNSALNVGGLGGGGRGSFNASNNWTSGSANTGSGGGGAGGLGGSGIIIIRYRNLYRPLSSIELIGGISGDIITDYSIINNDSDLKITSSVSGTPTDRLVISSSGNVGIGMTYATIYKLNVNGPINATSYLLGGVDILTKITETSNYVLSTSNILVTKANLNDTNSSNYVARISTDVNSRIWTTSQIPDLAIGKISGLQGAIDSKQATLTSTNTIGVFNTSHFTNNTGTNKIDLTSSSLSKWTNNSVDATKIYYNTGNVGIGTTNPRARLDLATPDNTITATSLLDFRNISDYGIYATSISIASRGNTLDFLARDYNGGANTIRNILTLRPEGNVGIGTTDTATYKLNVNGTINSSNYTLNGVPLNIGALSQGMTVQTKHLTYTQMDVKNNTGWEAINDDLVNGFVIAITPASASSKILVNMIAHIGIEALDYRWWGIKLYRKIGTGGAWTEITGANGTETGAAVATAGTPVWISHNMGIEGSYFIYSVANVVGTYLDAPNTTSIVYYTAYWNNRLGDNPSVSGTIYINRAFNHNDAYRPAPSSSWTATEIWDLGTPYVPPSGDTTITIASSSVGVGATPNANYKLIVNQGTSGATGATCFPLKISAGAFTNAGNSTATLIGLGTENNGTMTKCAIGHSRTDTNDRGSIVFLCNNTNDGTMVTMTDERMRITSAGNVGIGTNNPVNILQVGGAGRLRIANNNTDFTMIGSADVDGSANTTIVLSGTDRTSYNGQIDYVARSTGSHIFYTTASATERMRITSTGNVGIGTNNPLSGLHLHNNATTQDVRIILSDNTSTASSTRGLHLIKWSDNQSYLWNYENTALIFGTNNVERMRIANAGNVGIGTNNPLNILQVGGGGRLRIANDNTDYTLIGTADTNDSTNSTISLSGSGRTGINGTIDYVARSTGVHRFYTTSSTTERMRIASNGAVGIQTIGEGITNNYLSAGALTIGNTTQDYGGGITSWNSNTAGFLMECLNNTEIAVHDSGNSIHSFMRYTNNGNFRIGRDMGHGVANTTIAGTLTCDGTSTLTGRLGIGKAPHATYACDVNGTINATSVLVGGTAIISSQWVGTTNIYNTSGNVGIGTNNPLNILQVGGTGQRLKIANSSTDNTMIGTDETEGTNTRINIFGATHASAPGQISYVAKSTGNHIFFTTNSDTERMRIASGGNVGIGTNNPLALLDVVYSPPAVANTDMLNIRVDGNWGLKVQQSFTVAGNIQYNLIHRYNTVDYNSLTFKGPFIGVGTNNPSNKLHIVHSSTAANADTAGGIGLYVYNPTNTAGNNSVIINRIAGSAAGKVLYGFDVNAAYGYSIYMLGSSSDLRFNNGWDGGGTDVMRLSNTGNLGIGTSPHATYKLDVNGSINATSVLVGGTAISGSKWTTGATATNIYYSAGNVGIGTSTTSDVDNTNTEFAIPTATLFVKGGATTGGTCSVVIRGGVTGQNGGKSRLWLSADAFHSTYIQGEHISSGNTVLSFGTASGNALPTERMRIDQSGNVGIGTNNPFSALHLHKNATTTDCRIILSDNTSTASASRGLHLVKGTDNLSYLWNYENTATVFATNNVERMRIANTGNVGIGTNNPQQKLDIQGTNPTIRLLDTNADGNAIIQFRELSDLYGMDIAYIGNLDNKMYIRAFNNSAIAVNHITIDRASGRIGIGGNNPTASRMQVYGVSTETLIGQFHLLSGTSGINIGNNFIATDGTDTNIPLYIVTKGTGNLYFQTNTNTDRLTINGTSGNIGIGTTTNINNKLLICQGTTGSTGATCFPLRISAGAYSNTGNSTATLIGLATQEITGTTATKCAIGHCRTGAWDTGSIVFLCNNVEDTASVTMSDERMRIASNGNVSIGTTDTATYKLNVSGSINATSLFVNGTAFTGSSQWVGTTNIYNTSGNVGIGTNNPITAKLEVYGNMLLTGGLWSGADGFASLALATSAGSYSTSAITGDYVLRSSSTNKLLLQSGGGVAAIAITSTGNVGIGNIAPLGPLHIGNASIANSDGFLVLGKNGPNPSSRQYKIGITDTYEFAIGNFGINNVAGTWVQQFKIANDAPVNSAIIDGTGGLSVFGNITAYYSDERLKTKIANIGDPLKIIDKLNGFYYKPNELAHSFGITNNKQDIGLSAQEVQKVLPELVNIAPFDLEKDKDGNKVSKSGENYLTLSYDRLAPVFVEAIKELNQKNISLTKENNELKEKYNKLLEDITLIKQTLNLV